MQARTQAQDNTAKRLGVKDRTPDIFIQGTYALSSDLIEDYTVEQILEYAKNQSKKKSAQKANKTTQDGYRLKLLERYQHGRTQTAAVSNSSTMAAEA